MKFFLMPNFTKERTGEVLTRLCPMLRELGIGAAAAWEDREALEALGAVGVEYGTDREGKAVLGSCDLILSIGGDGTVIHSAYYGALYQKPVAGINVGRLGFLAQMEPEELGEYLGRLVAGRYSVEKRYAIQAAFSSPEFPSQPFAINDIVVSKTPNGNIADFDIYCNGKEIDQYLADGIIFATPTGSTAYALSAGGPVMDPGLATITVVPICPHSITTQPIVFGGEKSLSISSSAELMVVSDGRRRAIVPPNTRITIGKSPLEPSFISFNEDEFFEVLTTKIKHRG